MFAACEKEPIPEKDDEETYAIYELDIAYSMSGAYASIDTGTVTYFKQVLNDPDNPWVIELQSVLCLNGRESLNIRTYNLPTTFSIDTTIEFDNAELEDFQVTGYVSEDTLYGTATEIYDLGGGAIDTVYISFHTF